VATACSESESVDLKLLDESERMMRTIVDAGQRFRVLDALSAAFVRGRRLVDARRVAEEIDDPALCAIAVARIGLSESDVVERHQIFVDAVEIAKTETNASRRKKTLVDLAGTTLAAGALTLTRLVTPELPSDERSRVLQQLVLNLAREEDKKEFQDVMSEALSTIAELPHAEDQTAAYTDLGCVLLQLDCRTEAKRALLTGQLAAHSIPNKDYYEQLEAIASVVAMIVPQDGYFIQAAIALNRIGNAFATAGFVSDAETAVAEARQLLAAVEDVQQRETELSKIGQSSVSEPILKPESITTPKSESLVDMVRSGRLTEAATELEQVVRSRDASQTEYDLALHAVVRSLANINEVSTAFTVAEVISSAAERSHAQLSCVQAASRLGDRRGVERSFEAMVESVRCEKPFFQERLCGELFLALIHSDLLTEANQILDLMIGADANRVGLRLLDLVKELTATGHLDIADKVVNLISEPLWKEPAACIVSQGRSDLLKPPVLINDLISEGRIEGAAQLAHAIVNDYERSEALAALSIALAAKGDVDLARMVEAEIPKDIGSSLLSYEIAIEISSALARRGEIDNAIDVARAITFDRDRARAFAKLGPILAHAGHFDLAERLLLEGLTLVPTREKFLDTGSRIKLLGDLIEAASEAMLIEPTLLAAAELEKHSEVPTPDKWNPAGQILNYERTQEAAQSVAHRKRALQAIGAALIASERLGDAERIASALGEPALQAEMRRDGALRLVQKQHFSTALLALGRQKLDEWIKAFASWMPAIEEVQPGFSKTVLENVLQIAGWLRPDWAVITPLLRTSNIN
jgi:tetratricopeptide (TPR) repeat protein